MAAGAMVLVPGMALEAQSLLHKPDDRLRLPNDLLWGINGHPFRTYPGTLEAQLKLVKELGLTHYRLQFRAGYETRIDELLRLARDMGITILPILQPELDFDKETKEDLYKASFLLGKSMAKRYRNRIKIWELGNELENYAILRPCEQRDDGTKYPCEWGLAGGVDALDYYGPRWQKVSAVLKGLAEGVAESDPEAFRAMGTAGWGHLGAFDRMVADKIDWEITVWHDYAQVTEEYLAKLATFKKPIWITEFNAGGGGSETPEKNASMLKERIAYYRSVREKYDVASAFIYELLDQTFYGETFEAHQGMVGIEKLPHGGWKIGAIKPPGLAVKEVFSQPVGTLK